MYLLRIEQTSELQSICPESAHGPSHTSRCTSSYEDSQPGCLRHTWSYNQRYQIVCFPVISAVMSTEATGEAYEEEHVHTVYEQIASHFSSTRYKVRLKYISTAMNSNECMPIFVSAMANHWKISERPRTGLRRSGRGLWQWQISGCKSGYLHRRFGQVRSQC